MDRDKEIRRWSWRLRDLMREAGRTQRSIERDAGWGKGYLTQVLGEGRPALKVEHVLAILDLLGVSVEDFFGGLYGLHSGAAVAGFDPAAVERLIDRRLEEVLSAERAERQRQLESVRGEVAELSNEARLRTPEEVRALVERAVERELERLTETRKRAAEEPA
jgi:transcriptional regulator with XRE-family HTH domain